MSETNSPTDSNWYYAQDGNSIGPVPFATLQALHAAGQITDETFVVEEGSEQWKEYSSLKTPLSQPSATPSVSEDHKQPASPNEEDAKAKKEKENKQATQGCLGCSGIIIAIIFVATVFGKCSSSRNFEALKTPKERVEFLASEQFGDRLRNVDFKPTWEDRALIEINFKAKDNLTNNFIRQGIASEMRSIMTELFTRNLSVKPSIVVLSAWLPTTNNYGKDGEAEVYRVSLDLNEASKVNWEKAQSLDFTKIWNTILVHPQLSETAN